MMEWDVDRFLVCCVRARYDSSALHEARRIAHTEDVDWDQFLRQALVHTVAPLVYYTLRDDRDILPDRVREELRIAYYQASASNALLYEELADILRAFHGAGIPVILLKGAALAQGTYGNVALRPMSDLDILVRDEAMLRAEGLLAQRGYAVLKGAHSGLRHMTFKNTARSTHTLVEIHSHVVSSPYYRQAMPEQWLWQDPAALAIDGVPALTLSPEATIVHSCLHFLDHIAVQGTLLWLCDIAEVVQRKNVDWDRLTRATGEFRIVLPVRSLLETCQETLGLSLPGQVLDRIRSLRPGFVERRAYQFCLSNSRSTASKTLFDFLATPGLVPRVRLLSSRLFPPRSYIRTRYSVSNPVLVPFYYLRMILAAVVDAIRSVRRAPRR
jgi:hypothetical protein